MAAKDEFELLDEPKLPENATERQVEIFNTIMAFYHSDAPELPLPQFSKPSARVFAHTIADSLGIYHRSEGKGRDRHVVLAKTAPKAPCGYYDPQSATWVPYIYEVGDEVKFQAALGENNTLRCVTFNVLHDPENKPEELAIEASRSEENGNKQIEAEPSVIGFEDPTMASVRHPKCFDFLQSCDAHVITLNEVCKEFYEQLLLETWVQRYWIAELGTHALTPGNLILSKFPIRSSFSHQFKLSQKTNNVVEIALPSGFSPIWISTAHLKAGPFDKNGRFRRAQTHEMLSQLRYLCPKPNHILMGDFNIRSSEDEVIQALQNSCVDVWTHLHPTDPGLTYDPWNNTLAEFASKRVQMLDSKRTKVANRYDRIFINSPHLQPISARILAKEPIGELPSGENLYISDHWALEAVIQVSAPPAGPSTM